MSSGPAGCRRCWPARRSAPSPRPSPPPGAEPAASRTRATRVGPAAAPDGYRLDGTKSWISNAPEADRYLVFATLDPGLGRDGITAFLVEKGMPGFRPGRHERKMGIRACPASELIFEGCEVAVANRLGGGGGGDRIAPSAPGGGGRSRGAGRTRPAPAA